MSMSDINKTAGPDYFLREHGAGALPPVAGSRLQDGYLYQKMTPAAHQQDHADAKRNDAIRPETVLDMIERDYSRILDRVVSSGTEAHALANRALGSQPEAGTAADDCEEIPHDGQAHRIYNLGRAVSEALDRLGHALDRLQALG